MRHSTKESLVLHREIDPGAQPYKSGFPERKNETYHTLPLVQKEHSANLIPKYISNSACLPEEHNYQRHLLRGQNV